MDCAQPSNGLGRWFDKADQSGDLGDATYLRWLQTCREAVNRRPFGCEFDSESFRCRPTSVDDRRIWHVVVEAVGLNTASRDSTVCYKEEARGHGEGAGHVNEDAVEGIKRTPIHHSTPFPISLSAVV